MGKKVKRYTKEFKDTIVELYNNGKSYSELNSEYGVPKTTMLQWIKKDKSIKDGSFVANKKETENLKRIAELEEENEILKKALSIFAETK